MCAVSVRWPHLSQLNILVSGHLHCVLRYGCAILYLPPSWNLQCKEDEGATRADGDQQDEKEAALERFAYYREIAATGRED